MCSRGLAPVNAVSPPPVAARSPRGEAPPGSAAGVSEIAALHLALACEKLAGEMRRPSLGEFNLGALVGAILGSIGGLFAIGTVRAVLAKNAALLFGTPILGLISWVVCGVGGWLLGGQIGPRLGEKYYSQRAEIVGGALGGFIPVVLVVVWALYMSLR
jgi:hypothetical protein